MKFREHRGSLEESMLTVVELKPNMEALYEHCFGKLAFHTYTFCLSNMRLQRYGWDERIRWDTHIVTIGRIGVFGFTDGTCIGLCKHGADLRECPLCAAMRNQVLIQRRNRAEK